jgi:DNA-directed RNA polymerase specialized sigma24 family protein
MSPLSAFAAGPFQRKEAATYEHVGLSVADILLKTASCFLFRPSGRQPAEKGVFRKMITSEILETPVTTKQDAWSLQAAANAKKYKTVLYMRDRLGLTFGEIAHRTGYCVAYVQRTYNRAYMLMGKETKHEGRRHSQNDRDVRAKATAGLQPLIKNDEMAGIREHLRLEKFQTVLRLREAQNLTFAQAASKMGFSVSYVKCLYRKAKALRDHRVSGRADLRNQKRLEQYRVILALREERHLSFAEAGRQMGVGVDTARALYRQARAIRGRPGDNTRGDRDRIRLEKYRAVVHLRDSQNLSFAEISRRMGFSAAYVRKLYRQARAMEDILCGNESSGYAKPRLEQLRKVLFWREDRQLSSEETGRMMGYSVHYADTLYAQAVTMRQQHPELFKGTEHNQSEGVSDKNAGNT